MKSFIIQNKSPTSKYMFVSQAFHRHVWSTNQPMTSPLSFQAKQVLSGVVALENDVFANKNAIFEYMCSIYVHGPYIIIHIIYIHIDRYDIV